MENLTTMAQILGALAAVVAVFLAPIVAKWLKVDGAVMEQQQLLQLILTFVQAFEQQLKGSDPGGQLRRAAVERALVEKGYDITPEISAMIESAVWQVNNNSTITLEPIAGEVQEVSDR